MDERQGVQGVQDHAKDEDVGESHSYEDMGIAGEGREGRDGIHGGKGEGEKRGRRRQEK